MLFKPKDIKKLGIVPLVGKDVAKLGVNFEDRGGFKIPYFHLDGSVNKEMFRVRYLEGRKDLYSKGKVAKYMQPSDIQPTLYLPPLMDWEDIAKDVNCPILITEGELKSICGCLNGYPTIGIGGVYSWKSTARLLPMIPDFDNFIWKGTEKDDNGKYVQRLVTLVFDADLRTNPMVQRALKEFCIELTNKGAEPRIAFVTELHQSPKTGMDDYLLHMGAESFGDLLEDAQTYGMAGNLINLNNQVVFTRKENAVIELETGIMMKPEAFKNSMYSHVQHHEMVWSEKTDKMRMVKKQSATEWLKWSHRFELKGIVCEPEKPKFTDDDYYNMWNGWGCEPKKGNVKPWLDLMDYVFGKDKKARLWFERWCAIQFQHGGVKLFTSVLFWSTVQGSGKSFTGEVLGAIFGDENFSIATHDDLKRDTNKWRATKQFVLGEEITGGNKRSDADKMKALITSIKTQVNEKFQPIYMIRDFTNYLFTSNHSDAFFLEPTDRRFFVWELEAEPKSHAWFTDFKDNWLYKGGKEALFQYFLDLDLGDFTRATPAYKTEARQEMIEAGRSELGVWCEELNINPDNTLKIGNIAMLGDLFTSRQLVDLYNDTSNPTKKATETGLVRVLKQMTPPITFVHNGKAVRINDKVVRKLLAVRNRSKWLRKTVTPREIAKEYNGNK